MSKYKEGEALALEDSLYSRINPLLGTFLYEKLKITPNMVTTLTLVMSFIISWALFNDKYYLAVSLFLLRQILDSTDGYIARKYNLKSKFGEKYDNFSDMLNMTFMLGILIYKGRKLIMKNKSLFILISLTAYYLYNPIIDLRNNCLKNRNECSNEYTKHAILKNTKFFSLFETAIFTSICIIIFSTYIKQA